MSALLQFLIFVTVASLPGVFAVLNYRLHHRRMMRERRRRTERLFASWDRMIEDAHQEQH